jgi:hypothetical protein
LWRRRLTVPMAREVGTTFVAMRLEPTVGA